MSDPDADPEPVSPIRDDHQLGPTEDLDREPDGVPHDVVGRTVFASLVLAVVALAALATAGWPGALAVGVLAIPIMVFTLQRKSARERDPQHPSR